MYRREYCDLQCSRRRAVASGAVSEPERLALLTTVARHNGVENVNTSQTGALFEAVRDGASSLDLAACSGYGGVNFAGEGRLEFVQQQRVSAGYFRVLGVAPQYGREFEHAEDVPHGPPLAILSWDFWQRVYRGDPAVLGRSMNLRGEPYTIVGIMPKQFHGMGAIDLWTPLRPTRTGEGSGSNYGVVARLKPGVTWAAANSQLQSLSKSLVETTGFPREYKDFEERVVPLQSGETQNSRTQLWLTWGAVLMVLVIGCVNIAGLMLARAAGRHREIATVLALGGGADEDRSPASHRKRPAGSGRLCSRCALLGLCKPIPWLKELGAARLEMCNSIQLEYPGCCSQCSPWRSSTSVAFGLAPALKTRPRLDIPVGPCGRWARSRRDSAVGWTPHMCSWRLEVALSLVLLVSAGLMIRTLGYLNGLNPGFDTRNVISAQASLQDARYNTSVAVNRLYTRVARSHSQDSRRAVCRGGTDAALRAAAERRVPHPGWRQQLAPIRDRGGLCDAGLFRNPADSRPPRPRPRRYRRSRKAAPWQSSVSRLPANISPRTKCWVAIS